MKERKKKQQADYEEALKLGEVLAAYARVMFMGPAGVGKSSLLSGLMNLPLPLAESTKLAEALIVKYEWVKAGDPDDSYWSKLEEEDELMEVAKLVRIVAEDKSSKRVSVLASLIEAVAVKQFSPPTDVSVATSTEQMPDGKLQQEATEVRKNITSEILNKALHKHEASAATAQASQQKEAMIHVWDCGGQPVFLDVLPAFLTGRTMFFLIFDAKKGLESQYEAVYYHRGEVVPGSRKTQNITIRDLLLQWMASIHAMLCKSPSDVTASKYPRIIPIGTHGDDPEVQKKKKEILQTLSAHCEGKAFAPLLINSTIVDNTTAGHGKEEDKAYKYLRQQVHKFAMENAVPIPVAWFHFQKVFQEAAKENPIVPVEQADIIANACGIPVKTVPSILNFFHELAVFFYFSSVKSLRHCIIADPQWLVRQLAKLLALEGQESVQNQEYWKLLQQKGILIQPLYEEVWKGLRLPPQALVDLLEHFLLAVRINTQSQFHQIEGQEYFIPSMLDCKPESETQQSVSVKQASPLHLTFSTQYVPPGLFARLVTTLVKEPTCQLVFERGVFSNQVTFAYGEVEKIDKVTITEHTSSIQIDVIRLAHRRDPHTISMFQVTCRSILKLILEHSADVREWFPSIKVATALQCVECENDRHLLPVLSNSTVNSYLRCERGKVCHPSPSQQYWLNIPTSDKGDGSVSEAELRGISEEVKEAEKLEPLAGALEVVPFLKTVGGDPVTLMRRWCGGMGAQARSHLVYHLRSIGLDATADRLAYSEFSRDEAQSQSQTKKPNLKDLMEFVETTKWYALGLQLDVNDYKLEVILEDTRGNTEEGRRRMLKQWLDSSAKPTWMSIVEALNKIKQQTLAAKIKTEFID